MTGGVMIKLWNRILNRFILSCPYSSQSSSPSPLPSSTKGEIKIIYHDKRSKKDHVAFAKSGQDLLHLAHDFNVDLEGACDGSLACSTCHVIIDSKENYDRLGVPTDEENDMLDLAFGLTDKSRLSCQIKAEPWMNGMKVIIPEVTRNMAVDGYRPKPH